MKDDISFEDFFLREPKDAQITIDFNNPLERCLFDSIRQNSTLLSFNILINQIKKKNTKNNQRIISKLAPMVADLPMQNKMKEFSAFLKDNCDSLNLF